ncbi:MAG: hypothetical protein EDS66_03880 [Planctomycetota bacterium]|nr:MAG: hypothetical protein EDS66_03880 [Planctomycetota bacterium]KAB2946498.1 MAG: hypothetical protein F9K17_08470 [Phycisphaerae bacterium]MCQ3920979.1 hypothetical protein [Planctomycetota bacterium]
MIGARSIPMWIAVCAAVVGSSAAANVVPAADALPGTPPSTPAPPGEPTSSASPQDRQAAQPPPQAFADPAGATATGDWGGWRRDLKSAGVDFQLYYNQQFQAVLKGGRTTDGSPRGSASFDLILILDLEKLSAMPETEALIHAQQNCGLGVNAYVDGLTQVNDDADGHVDLHVGQAWVRKHFLDRRVSLTVGFLDFQTIVDRNAVANSEDKQFLHQMLDNNPLIPLNIGLGAALSLKPIPQYTFIAGAGDAESILYKPGFSTALHDDSAFFAYLEHEITLTLPSARGSLPGSWRVGLVYDPRDKNVLLDEDEKPRTRTDDYGYYVSADQRVFREQAGSEQGLSIFGRYGYRDSRLNRTNTFWSAGVSYRGLIPGRDNDVAAFGFAAQTSSAQYRRFVNETAGTEAVYELYYAIELTPWCVLTPDVQYVHNPGAIDGVGHAVTAGVRLRLSF